MSRREIIQIHIGQAGVQMANSCWELYCLEHGIKPDGTLYDPNRVDDSYSSFFHLNANGQVVPRVVMIDLEPTVIDEIRIGCYRKLFSPSLLLTGKEDAANNFARGKYGIGQNMLELVLDRVRGIVEKCGNMQGFIIFRAYGGGTGGGLGSLFLQELSSVFPKCTNLEFDVFPSPKLSNIIVEPYNTVLATHSSGEFQDLSFILDNEAMYDLLCAKLAIDRPTFANVNRIIGQIVSNVTTSLRYEGAINVDLKEFQSNLVPYKRLHYPLVTSAPFFPVNRQYHEQRSVASLTNACFKNGSQMVGCEPQTGKYLSCCLLYRGDVTPVDVNNAIVSIQKKKVVQFVDWSPSGGYKVGINYMPPLSVPGGDIAKINRGVTMLATTTAIKCVWKNILRKYNLMWAKRAFVHHFVDEGMEESEFHEAKEDLKALLVDYSEIEV